MALIQGWYPPSKENYDLILLIWCFFPLNSMVQWIMPWYGMGKTSVTSKLNIPGRLAWFTMEVPGFLTLLYMVLTLPGLHGITDLPWQNQVLAGLFVIHYLYRAVLFPFLQPSMSPIHVAVWLAALAFQLFNGTLLGSWLAAYGPVTEAAWRAQLGPFPTLQFAVGIALFYVGLAANFYHDDELREIRRRELQRQEKVATESGGGGGGGRGRAAATVDKHYRIPQAGLFRYVLYPHYLAEWAEWFGFYVACGFSCTPALMFLVNEVSAMLPRAVKGRRWYAERFGEEKIRGKRAVIPGIL
ncbi:3-oxo-5-alpha-steroid 4-dehydrogenase [Cryphonectria parasitica EP155]|uniref:3-oxo-5-alpha-steroid 4-dehydrogenase n=1 Tax=Cryphonectria parasitica (strain ATCC 38755 / EP155) TaxID=660469 RepID=A0A9P4Y4P6_CRYP1|nr:3-oxo-5-alpha-steroid 4-dehydrogenase [Cryphonectria parasitica EP155]KAF3766409.1 3-oxo-5-alpha-steroid 4-dehydrogenase [Cryphonectria parasitica EP155]